MPQWAYESLLVSGWAAYAGGDRGLAAGLYIQMPSAGGGGQRKVLEAVRAGELSEADIDLAVRRVLTLVDRAQPALESGQPFDVSAHHALARDAAAASAVLLKNEDGILPLAQEGGTVAVIGEF